MAMFDCSMSEIRMRCNSFPYQINYAIFVSLIFIIFLYYKGFFKIELYFFIYIFVFMVSIPKGKRKLMQTYYVSVTVLSILRYSYFI